MSLSLPVNLRLRHEHARALLVPPLSREPPPSAELHNSNIIFELFLDNRVGGGGLRSATFFIFAQFPAIFRNFCFQPVRVACLLVPCVSPVQKCCSLRLWGFDRGTAIFRDFSDWI